MEDKSFRIKTQKELLEAEHLLTVTYVMTKDQKIFLSIVMKLYDALDSAMNSFLGDELLSKDTFVSKLSKIRNMDGKVKLSDDDFELFTLIKQLVEEHKKSPMEFARKEKFIIADDVYSLHTLTPEILKEYLLESKKIIAELLMKS